MNGEPVNFLKLSANPMVEHEAISAAPSVIEDFLDQLDGEQQLKVLSKLINGEALVSKFGEVEGRELAAYHLAMLMEAVGKSAFDLSDISVFDVVIPDLDTTTDVELTKIARL